MGGGSGPVAWMACILMIPGAHVAASRAPHTHPPTQAVAEGMDGVARVEQRPLSLDEAKGAKEVLLASGSLPVMPVVQVGLGGGGWGRAASGPGLCAALGILG